MVDTVKVVGHVAEVETNQSVEADVVTTSVQLTGDARCEHAQLPRESWGCMLIKQMPKTTDEIARNITKASQFEASVHLDNAFLGQKFHWDIPKDCLILLNEGKAQNDFKGKRESVQLALRFNTTCQKEALVEVKRLGVDPTVAAEVFDEEEVGFLRGMAPDGLPVAAIKAGVSDPKLAVRFDLKSSVEALGFVNASRQADALRIHDADELGALKRGVPIGDAEHYTATALGCLEAGMELRYAKRCKNPMHLKAFGKKYKSGVGVSAEEALGFSDSVSVAAISYVDDAQQAHAITYESQLATLHRGRAFSFAVQVTTDAQLEGVQKGMPDAVVLRLPSHLQVLVWPLCHRAESLCPNPAEDIFLFNADKQAEVFEKTGNLSLALKFNSSLAGQALSVVGYDMVGLASRVEHRAQIACFEWAKVGGSVNDTLMSECLRCNRDYKVEALKSGAVIEQACKGEWVNGGKEVASHLLKSGIEGCHSVASFVREEALSWGSHVADDQSWRYHLYTAGSSITLTALTGCALWWKFKPAVAMIAKGEFEDGGVGGMASYRMPGTPGCGPSDGDALVGVAIGAATVAGRSWLSRLVFFWRR